MTRNEMIQVAASYIVVDDGQSIYPVLRSDLRDGDTERTIRAMSGDEYAEWCQTVPCDARAAKVGSPEMSDLCDELIEAGAEYWQVA